MAPPSSVCVKCNRTSAASTGSLVNDNFVCRWCQILEDYKKEIQVERDIRSRLESRVIRLEEEVVLLQGKVNQLSGSENESSVCPPPKKVNLNSRPTYAGVVKANSSIRDVSKNNKTNANNDFIAVKNGIKPRVKPVIGVETYNSFSILGREDLNEPEIRLVGDSIVRGQLEEFCGRNPRKRRLYTIPGAKIDDVIGNVRRIKENSSDETTFILHVGTNEIHSTRSEELLDKYRKLIHNFKASSNHIILSGILPRITWRTDFFSKASYINNSLKAICHEENIEFVNFWNNFYENELMYRPDGLHLNDVGSARFGRLLDKAVNTFHSKNDLVISRSSTR